jgi:hypothetical protein
MASWGDTRRIRGSESPGSTPSWGSRYTAKFVDNMREFGIVGEEVRRTVLRILEEVPPESYEPPKELEEPPGCPFIFGCALGREVFFKLQIVGTPRKPRVLFWSCHPPLYGGKK